MNIYYSNMSAYMSHYAHVIVLQLKVSKKSESSKGSVVSNKSNQDDLEMSIANDDENMEDTEEATEMQHDMQEISHQMTKSLACNDVSSKEVSDVKVQGLGGSSSCLQGCTSVEVGCIKYIESILYLLLVSIQ